MADDDVKRGSSDFSVDFELEPIISFGNYIESVAASGAANNSDDVRAVAGMPVLVSKGGELIEIAKGSKNSGFLEYDGVAQAVAEDRGYFFFPGGSVDGDNVFSREFSYGNFVHAAQAVLNRIDPKATYAAEELHAEQVQGEVDILRANLEYLEDATLSWKIKGVKGMQVVAGLNEGNLGGFSLYEEGFLGAWLTMGLGDDYQTQDRRIRRSHLNARICLSDVVKSRFSRKNFKDLGAVVRNISRSRSVGGQKEEGVSYETSMEFDEGNSELAFGFRLRDKNSGGRVFSVGEMVNPFVSYLHLIKDTAGVVVDAEKERLIKEAAADRERVLQQNLAAEKARLAEEKERIEYISSLAAKVK